MPKLILRPGEPGERVFELREGAQTIGRARDSEIYVPDESLSRRHARLMVTGAAVTIEDCDSRNGTFVDGLRVDRRELSADHYVKCGDVVFAFRGRDAAAPEPLAPSLTIDWSGDLARRPLEELVATAATRELLEPDRARERLGILLQVSELLSSPKEIGSVLEQILGLAFRMLAIDRAALLMSRADGSLEPEVTRTRGMPEASSDTHFSRRIVAQAVEAGVAMLFEDVGSDPRLAESGSIVRQSICASMCAPLLARDGRLLGALYVDNVTRPRPFTKGDLELLAGFASQAAIAIDNARLTAALAEQAAQRANLLRFFPPAAIEPILRQGLEVIETEATIVFCDLCGFTALSSRRSPRQMIELLDAYFPVMARIVFDHEGTLEKYVGDALLAAWGAPLGHPDDAERAVRAAIDMQRAMEPLSRRWPDDEPLRVHVGVASGPVAAGSLGSGSFLQYATIGDVTNRAARICGLAGAEEIVVDDETRRRLQKAWPFEALPPAAAKGKEELLLVHRLEWRRAGPA